MDPQRWLVLFSSLQLKFSLGAAAAQTQTAAALSEISTTFNGSDSASPDTLADM